VVEDILLQAWEAGGLGQLFPHQNRSRTVPLGFEDVQTSQLFFPGEAFSYWGVHDTYACISLTNVITMDLISGQR
jgi:hypothetical protein